MKKILVIFILVSFSSCTQPGDTTTIGATAGGVLGAGVGALVGSQTGSVGGGLVVGGLAGTVAGAAVGNALEAHEVQLRRQDEAIERQQRMIASQDSEIRELRRLGQDSISYREGTTITTSKLSKSSNTRGRHLKESNIAVMPEEARGAIKWKKRKPLKPVATRSKATVKKREIKKVEIRDIENKRKVFRQAGNTDILASRECMKAEQEVVKAGAKDDISDKLFHYRRALRLCPDSPRYHNGLGELYLSLSREPDAEFEFQEAVRLDSSFAKAKKNLAKLQ